MCIAAGVDALGINLVPGTPRAVSVELARQIADAVRERVRLVSVVANRGLSELRELRHATGIEWLQLHGDEPNELLASLLPNAYKAVRIGAIEDVVKARSYGGDLLLVDAKAPGKLGGTGKLIDFGLVAPLARERKLVLAGGLGPENVAQAIAAVGPYAVDVASGVEAPGDPRRKDPERVAAFVRAVRAAF